MNNIVKYDRFHIILHWLIAAMIIGMIALGLFMVELPKKSELPPGEESVRAFYFLLHKSLGITAALLILVRIIWRLTHTPPPLPDSIPSWQQRASGVVHGLLYFAMIAMPLTGYLQSMYSKYHTKFWGIELPRLAEANNEMKAFFSEIHEYVAFAFIAIIFVHIAAAVKHRIEGSGITDRMSLK
jgi:cytochrome b561